MLWEIQAFKAMCGILADNLGLRPSDMNTACLVGMQQLSLCFEEMHYLQLYFTYPVVITFQIFSQNSTVLAQLFSFPVADSDVKTVRLLEHDFILILKFLIYPFT